MLLRRYRNKEETKVKETPEEKDVKETTGSEKKVAKGKPKDTPSK